MVISDIISNHIIKPSSPTPERFRKHKLSFLDQMQGPAYIQLIFFYRNDESKLNHHVEISQLLKQSLSKTLTVFYPLAGTIKENSFVDCNDTGVELIEARVRAPIAQVIQEPKMEKLKQLVTVDCSSHNDNAILSAKISFFDCGGIGIGVSMSHKVGDLASFSAFMNAWAAACRGENDQIMQPVFDMATHFPPKESIPLVTLNEEKVMTNILVFDREILESLRQQAASDEVTNPTRVEAVVAFLLQNLIEAAKTKSNTEKTSFAVCHAVNLRPRTTPTIPDHTFGNASIGHLINTPETADVTNLVSKLRSAVKSLDDDHIKKLFKDGDNVKKLSNRQFTRSLVCCFSSWWRFPLYDVDFGWGKPVRVCTTPCPLNNVVYLMGTPSGDGIEAWINVAEDHFAMLESSHNKLFH